MYADGPTRVLCFSEDRSGAADDENSLLNLSYRLQRVGWSVPRLLVFRGIIVAFRSMTGPIRALACAVQYMRVSSTRECSTLHSITPPCSEISNLMRISIFCHEGRYAIKGG